MTTPAGQDPRLNRATAAAEAITAARLIAIVRTHRSEDAVRAVRTLAAAGVQVAEISLSTPGALEALERSAEEVGDRMLLGAGTVRSERDAARAMSAGARFLVSPSLDGGLVAYARESDVLHLPGVMSPTELAGALASGAQLVKLFPAARLGAGYVGDLLAPFPEARLVPTGGITYANFSTFLDAGSVAVAVGSDLVGPATIADPNALAGRAAQFLSLIGTRTKGERSDGN